MVKSHLHRTGNGGGTPVYHNHFITHLLPREGLQYLHNGRITQDKKNNCIYTR